MLAIIVVKVKLQWRNGKCSLLMFLQGVEDFMTRCLMTLMIPEGTYNFLIRHICHLIKANFARIGQWQCMFNGFFGSFVHVFF